MFARYSSWLPRTSSLVVLDSGHTFYTLTSIVMRCLRACNTTSATVSHIENIYLLATIFSRQCAVMKIDDAVVSRGKHAWGRIKTTAAEQRELWRQVGEALNYGRRKNPSNQGFGQWLSKNGLSDNAPKTRSDAIWLAANWTVVGSTPERNLSSRKPPQVVQREPADILPLGVFPRTPHEYKVDPLNGR